MTRPTTGARLHRHLLTAHIVTAVGLLGVDLVLAALGLAGLRGDDPRTIYPAAHDLSEWLAVPLAAGAVVTGALVTISGRHSFRTERWLATKLVISLVLLTLLLVSLVPGLHDASHSALATDTVDSATRLRLAIAPTAASVALLVNVALGRYRPALSRRAAAGRDVRPGLGS